MYSSYSSQGELGDLFIFYIVRDTCISAAHVSNRLRFDTFSTFILSFENGVSNK